MNIPSMPWEAEFLHEKQGVHGMFFLNLAQRSHVTFLLSPVKVSFLL